MGHTNKNRLLLLAGCSSMIAALLHVAVIIGGPDWYRAFGAGEQMATMAEQGKSYPMIVTMFIVAVLATWGLYAFSGANYIVRLPLLRTCLVLITAVYCVRGVAGLFVPFFSSNPELQSMGLMFWLLTSSICLFIGTLYLLGLKQTWKALTRTTAGDPKA